MQQVDQDIIYQSQHKDIQSQLEVVEMVEVPQIVMEQKVLIQFLVQ